MNNDNEKECTDSEIDSGCCLSGDNSNLEKTADLQTKENATTTSTPKSKQNGGEIDPTVFNSATLLTDISYIEPRRFILRSVTKVASTNHREPQTRTISELCAKNDDTGINQTERDLEDSELETTVDDSNDNDISFIVGSNTMSNKSKTKIFLDLNHYVIVTDESHVASDEPFGEICGSRSSSNQKDVNETKTKRKLWNPNSFEDLDQSSVESDDHANRSVQVASESKEIKLKVPIPTFLIPTKFRKNKTNKYYSPVTSNVLSTPKSFLRKAHLSSTTKFPDKICGFFESLDAAIVPAKFSDPNALYYRDNFRRKRDVLLSRLVSLYDQKVFDGKLCHEFVSVAWDKSTPKIEANCEFRKRDGTRTAVIKLNDNISTASRLRDCLIAELCRAAAWVLNEDVNLEIEWKKWAERANERISELPLIEIADNYEFVCECNICNLRSFARSQPKGIEKTFCVHCHGHITIDLNQKDVYGKLVMHRTLK